MDILFARQIEIGDTINQSQVTSHHQAKSKKPNHKSSKIFQGIKHRVSLTRFGNIYIYIYVYTWTFLRSIIFGSFEVWPNFLRSFQNLV
jgi:hypothetical protein